MSQILKPRPVAADAWKTWLREAARLSRRTAPTLLPIALVVGLGLAAAVGFSGAVGAVLMGVVAAGLGLWQAAFLHASERAAAGERITAGTVWEGVRSFMSQPPGQLWQHLRQRLKVLAVLFLLTGAIAVLWIAATPAASPSAAAPPARTGWALALWLCDRWTTLFLWGTIVQKGGTGSLANALVRGHGVDWSHAWILDAQNMATNRLAMVGLMSVGFFILMLVIALPPLVFAMEVFWAALATVAYRDIYLSQATLAAQPARAGALRPALLQARQASLPG